MHRTCARDGAHRRLRHAGRVGRPHRDLGRAKRRGDERAVQEGPRLRTPAAPLLRCAPPAATPGSACRLAGRERRYAVLWCGGAVRWGRTAHSSGVGSVSPNNNLPSTWESATLTAKNAERSL